jgi:hypothetical protein
VWRLQGAFIGNKMVGTIGYDKNVTGDFFAPPGADVFFGLLCEPSLSITLQVNNVSAHAHPFVAVVSGRVPAGYSDKAMREFLVEMGHTEEKSDGAEGSEEVEVAKA